ncbi:hypothetical protein [Microbacterium sp. NIBRBAC000506063]|uniref:hypothetical protein n=1 Tax=Microbacterium sp. NIBRBAC000506063 TaxID=2734618 RepID=UPI001CB6F5F4|nr:hypothetical protein [Microbacterium sp. NIBRBAC000506063]
MLLALTTAVTIRMSLRPLRAVAATAIRVANQPLAEGPSRSANVCPPSRRTRAPRPESWAPP